jgi:hypothetical protein
MDAQDHRHPDETPLRNLWRIGLVAVAAAIAIAAFGIYQRRAHEAEIKQWTKEQAIPKGRGD